MTRASGILMHVSSLYGDYSVGAFGDEAKDFIDFLADCGFSYWQVLPFNMIDASNSPYQSYSAFGGNPYFIDLPTLRRKGYITDDELAAARQNTPYLCEYERLLAERLPLLTKAAQRFILGADNAAKLSKFLTDYPDLADAARFLALKQANDNRSWHEWTVTTPDPTALTAWQFIQYEFFTQWQEIKSYANKKGVRVIGDIPIYVSLDSCDVWANRDQFLLDGDGKPTALAGCPPDYFCEDGQLWGNPIYDWAAMAKDGFGWWTRRISYMLTLFDGVRIDHFRGLSSYWSIPANAKTAREGKWMVGPGAPLIDKLRAVAGDKLIIAEDLGDITPDVTELLSYSRFPGMRVFQFAFLGDKCSPHLPHNYPANSVAYTGTHDNNTLLGHVWEISGEARKRAFAYCNYEGDDWSRACEYILKTMLASPADTVIFPIQDLLIYGEDTRMNIPGRAENNWRYRITREQLAHLDRNKYFTLNELYSRK